MCKTFLCTSATVFIFGTSSNYLSICIGNFSARQIVSSNALQVIVPVVVQHLSFYKLSTLVSHSKIGAVMDLSSIFTLLAEQKNLYFNKFSIK